MSMAYIWLILLVVFLIIEGATVTLTSIWFAVGCLGGILVSVLGGPIWLQAAAALVISLALLLCLRPMVRRFIQPRIVKTNVDSVAGKTGTVTETIDNNAPSGQVRMDGSVWTARSTNGFPIPEGTLVRVDEIKGVKAMVTPVYAEEYK